jgi:hypothetical protein
MACVILHFHLQIEGIHLQNQLEISIRSPYHSPCTPFQSAGEDAGEDDDDETDDDDNSESSTWFMFFMIGLLPSLFFSMLPIWSRLLTPPPSLLAPELISPNSYSPPS